MEETATASLGDLTVRDLIGRLSTRDPVPGGGSAAAIAGAMGAGLVHMVVELTSGRRGAEPHEALLSRLRSVSEHQHAQLLDLAQRDSEAYDRVVRSRRMPRDTEEQKADRRTALDAAMHDAADAPLKVARLAIGVLRAAAELAPVGNVNAVSDAGVAALLGDAALRGAILNVRINLPYLPEGDPIRADARAEIETLAAEGNALRDRVLATVAERMSS